jgi:hypothetical protein
VEFVELPKGTVGLADYARGIISINKHMRRPAQEATFIHEMYHFMNTTMNHALLDSLAEQTYQVFRHNRLWK